MRATSMCVVRRQIRAPERRSEVRVASPRRIGSRTRELGTYAAAAGMHKCAFLVGAVGIGAYPTADWTIDAAVATPFTAGGATWSTGASRAIYNGVMAWNLQGVTLTSNTGIVIPQSYTHAYLFCPSASALRAARMVHLIQTTCCPGTGSAAA